MSTYPNLQTTDTIAIDLETKDTSLLDLGPGYHRAVAGMEDSRILIVSAATADHEWWFEWNEHTQKWLQDNEHLNVIGANLVYDLGWLAAWGGVRFKGRCYDILTQESLIDGGQSFYSLDKLAKQYLGVEKGNDEIKDYADNMAWKGDARQHLWRMPSDLVGRYAASDTRQTYDIYQAQEPRLKELGLEQVADLESRLIPVLLRMRLNGVRVDVDKIPVAAEKLTKRIETLEQEVNEMAGMEVNSASSQSCATALEALGIRVAKTDAGNPSVDKYALEKISHPIAEKIQDVRKLRKLYSTYIDGMQRFLVGDRLYTEFIPVKNGRRGAETRRFSAQNPALQTIPQRGEGKEIVRSLFLPEEGCLWEKQDQSQEEYRIFAHYSRGKGTEHLVKGYREDSDFDMHTYGMQVLQKTKPDTTRTVAKTINFLTIYGGGVHKFAAAAGMTVPPPWSFRDFDGYNAQRDEMIREYEAAKTFFAYHDMLPCLKETAKAAEKAAKARGYARTMLGYRRYLPPGKAYKALNTTIQGTGGEIMKLWLVQCEEAGLWDILTPSLTIHDEIDFSHPGTPEGEAAAKEVQRIGETCLELKVPLKVDREQGPNWAEVAEIV